MKQAHDTHPAPFPQMRLRRFCMRYPHPATGASMKQDSDLHLRTDIFRAVIEIDRCGSISHAAANMYMSQPNLSAQVRTLEDTLGYRIFERSNSGVRATAQGRMFLDSARINVNELENIKNVPSRFSSDQSNLSISCVFSVVILNHFLSFRSEFPGNQANDLFKETGLRRCIEDIASRQYRLGFVYEFHHEGSDLEELAKRYLLDFHLLAPNIPILAIMSKDHPLSKRSSIPLEVLATTPLVAFEYLKDDNWLEAMGLSNPHEVLYISDRGGMLEIITRGRHVGISIGTPFFNVKNEALVSVPITGINRVINQYWVKPSNYQLSFVEEKFLDYVTHSDSTRE